MPMLLDEYIAYLYNPDLGYCSLSPPCLTRSPTKLEKPSTKFDYRWQSKLYSLVIRQHHLFYTCSALPTKVHLYSFNIPAHQLKDAIAALDKENLRG